MRTSGVTLTIDKGTFQKLEIMSVFLDIKANKLLKQMISDEFLRLQSKFFDSDLKDYPDENFDSDLKGYTAEHFDNT